MHTLRNVKQFHCSVLSPWLLDNHTSTMYQDTTIHCKDMVLHTNRIMVGLLFPQLASWDGFNINIFVEVILPDWESSEVEEKIEKLLLVPYIEEKKYIGRKHNTESNVEECEVVNKEQKSVNNNEQLDSGTNIKESLGNIENSETKKVSYDCEKCDKSYSHISALNKHKPLHDGSVQCGLCDKTYKSAFTLKVHVRLMHSTKDKTEEYACAICPHVNKSKNNLHHHMKYVHCSERTYMCSMCDKKFKTKSNLSQHEALHTGDYKTSKCNVCGVVIKGNGKSPMEYHMKSHVKISKWKCDDCSYYFRSQTNLIDHNEMYHAE